MTWLRWPRKNVALFHITTAGFQGSPTAGARQESESLTGTATASPVSWSAIDSASATRISWAGPLHLFGVVEAGCKVVAGSRLKRSGTHWTVRGANAIIALRCYKLSGRFEDFWERRAHGAAA